MTTTNQPFDPSAELKKIVEENHLYFDQLETSKEMYSHYYLLDKFPITKIIGGAFLNLAKRFAQIDWDQDVEMHVGRDSITFVGSENQRSITLKPDDIFKKKASAHIGTEEQKILKNKMIPIVMSYTRLANEFEQTISKGYRK